MSSRDNGSHDMIKEVVVSKLKHKNYPDRWVSWMSSEIGGWSGWSDWLKYLWVLFIIQKLTSDILYKLAGGQPSTLTNAAKRPIKEGE